MSKTTLFQRTSSVVEGKGAAAIPHSVAAGERGKAPEGVGGCPPPSAARKTTSEGGALGISTLARHAIEKWRSGLAL